MKSGSKACNSRETRVRSKEAIHRCRRGFTGRGGSERRGGIRCTRCHRNCKQYIAVYMRGSQSDKSIAEETTGSQEEQIAGNRTGDGLFRQAPRVVEHQGGGRINEVVQRGFGGLENRSTKRQFEFMWWLHSVQEELCDFDKERFQRLHVRLRASPPGQRKADRIFRGDWGGASCV